jgi:hypothetical protein
LFTFDFDVIRISCITGADSSTAVTAWLFLISDGCYTTQKGGKAGKPTHESPSI